VRLLLAESAVLAAAGGMACIYAARWSLDVLMALVRDELPQGVPVEADTAVLWFCVIVSLFAAALAGLIPALRVTQIDLQAALKDAGGPAGTALRRNRSLLMVWEVALALVLAIGALLLIRSLRVLNRFDLGFRPERVLTMKLALPGIRYSKPEEAVAFYEGLLEEACAIPGVSSAGLINYLPIQAWRETRNFTIQGRETPPPGHEPAADLRRVSAGYFQALGIPLLAGRYLRQDDTAGREPVVLISRLVAERYFPNENPLGRSIRFGIKVGQGDWTTIVGIVGDVRDRGVYRPAPTVIYAPYGQTAWPQQFMSLVLRASLEPETLTGALRRLVRNRDPDAAVFLVRTMEQVVSDSVAGTRLLSRLLTIFSLLALVLAVAGVYGVMSYLVSQRTHEIGVRMALGAGRREVVRMVLGRGLRNALAGAALGLMLTVMASVAMRRFVIGIGVVDVWTYLSAVLGILAVVLVASAWPAWRASRVDPLVALRNE
jgi:putative ABC transport system permease protein